MNWRVLIADDHLFVSWSLEKALSSVEGLTIVGSVANGIDAIASIRKHKPDCVILDYNMPGANGLEVFLEARRWSPETRFILITGSVPAETLIQLVDAGIHGVILKDGSETDIANAVRDVCEGKTVIGDSAARLMLGAGESAALTERELAVLQAIARGHSNASAAELLGVSPKTVDSHRTSLMRKLGVHSTASLLLTAVRSGLVDPTSLR
jgi:DNA-binding NarL/FixJ family response regulator